MEFDGIDVIKVKLETGEKVKIISFLELPRDKVQWMAEAEPGLESLQRGAEVVELCLMNPKEMEKFAELDVHQFLAFITEWTYRSAKSHNKKKKKQRQEGLGSFDDDDEEE
jgi:hypothetical protein